MVWIFVLVVYLITANIFAYIAMAKDKDAAQKKQWRIKESTLMWIAALGGSIGMLWAMHKLRHKTKHDKFRLGVPLILLCQILLAIFIIVMIYK
ncbi:MAG: DUF1294 domain-containing protein [Clostridiales bacterium]|nr:DUF1294 domain-containing protein [Clostridiales bacterium]